MIRKMMNWQPNITLYTSAAPVPTSGSIIRPINAATLSKSLRGKKIMLYAFYSETAYHGWNNGGAYKVIQETYFLTLGLSSSGCLRLLFSSFKIQRLYKGRVCLGNWKFLDVLVVVSPIIQIIDIAIGVQTFQNYHYLRNR